MTTGPEPRIRTDWGFVTPDSPAVSLRGGHEPVEHRQRVEWTGCAFRVVLDGLDREGRVAQPLDGPVVEVHLADVEAGVPGQGLGEHLDLVVLGGDLDEAGVDI